MMSRLTRFTLQFPHVERSGHILALMEVVTSSISLSFPSGKNVKCLNMESSTTERRIYSEPGKDIGVSLHCDVVSTFVRPNGLLRLHDRVLMCTSATACVHACVLRACCVRVACVRRACGVRAACVLRVCLCVCTCLRLRARVTLFVRVYFCSVALEPA